MVSTPSRTGSTGSLKLSFRLPPIFDLAAALQSFHYGLDSDDPQPIFKLAAYEDTIANVLDTIPTLNAEGIAEAIAQFTVQKRPPLPVPDCEWTYLLNEVKNAAAAMGRGRKRREKERKEVGRAVEKYFAERQGSAAVERLEHFQRVFRGTKEIASMVRKKWMLIDRVVRKRLKLKDQLRLKQDGKEKLEAMLKHSHIMLVGQVGTEDLSVIDDLPASSQRDSEADSVRTPQPLEEEPQLEDLFQEDNVSSTDDDFDMDEGEQIGSSELDDDGSSSDDDLRSDDLCEVPEIMDESPGHLQQDPAILADPAGQDLKEVAIPYLLRGTLREYQHHGLNWLVSLHESQVSGILADEMGLGKTIQTIAFLAHLALEHRIWGPHLIVVPTSVIMNWEMELKKWCPALKILTYYGSQKERAEKRHGWTKWNAFHVCITSYQIVVHDQSSFKRMKWEYLVLDEAHNIKNFRSQRWQVLLNFNSNRRLLLTGTPLQNNLTELWSLLYFLMPPGSSSTMPEGFATQKEFQEWFAQPVNHLVNDQGNVEAHKTLTQLHTVLRPYLLRRLKKDVEKQMPGKFEHVIYCRLSKRQRYLYDDFMAQAETRETLSSGNFLSVINILMQLRKVCNHPDLFAERPIQSPLLLSFDIITRQSVFALSLILARMVREVTAFNRKTIKQSTMMTWFNIIGDVGRYATHDWDLIENPLLQVKLWQEEMRCASVLESRSCQAGPGKFKDLVAYGRHMRHRQTSEERVFWIHQRYTSGYRNSMTRLYSRSLLSLCTVDNVCSRTRKAANDPKRIWEYPSTLLKMLSDPLMYFDRQPSQVLNFVVAVNKVVATASNSFTTYKQSFQDIFHPVRLRFQAAFPEPWLLQYDCGKFQALDGLLRKLKDGNHRALIFTQMTRVLDILEQFLNIHGYRYLRLDGSTKIQQRQALCERFNNDNKVTVFILSTRSGGLGLNLTGADTVIFYDSDWNPAMDAQAQDRCHRIGQTREVHIYRLIAKHTVEENMLRKVNQKRMLDDMVIQNGKFTTEWFSKRDVLDIFDPETIQAIPKAEENPNVDLSTDDANWETAIANVEDTVDANAAHDASMEIGVDVDAQDFDETAGASTPSIREGPIEGGDTPTEGVTATEEPASDLALETPILEKADVPISEMPSDDDDDPNRDPEDDDDVDETVTVDEEIGHIDSYMLRFMEIQNLIGWLETYGRWRGGWAGMLAGMGLKDIPNMVPKEERIPIRRKDKERKW